MAFADSHIASVAYRGEVGVGIEGNVMLYKKDAETALHSTDVYKTLQGNEIQFKWFYRTGIPVKLLWFEWPNSQKPHDNVFERASLVPNFSDTKLERDIDNTTLLASTKANGACLPVDLGFTLFEQESTNSVQPSYSRFGYAGMNADLYASFFNMSTSKKYEVYPTVKLLGVEMLAEPMAKEKGDTTCPDSNHPHYIDLGLPSGTMWCCCNEGASSPEQYGSYLTFDEAQGYNPPSFEQIKELLYYCIYNWTTQNGVNGGKFTGPNGGSVFLPAAGIRNGSIVGSWGIYWSSTPYDEYTGFGLDFYSGNADWYDGYRDRGYGQSVRPVR